MQLVECVPNFSEGRRQAIIDSIRDAAAAVANISVLDVHADAAHNRMVLTLVGGPRAAVEAAFCCAERAAQLIDMRQHVGEHPRIGATDVVPFVPVSGVTMLDCVALANELGQRLADELEIPVYLYAEAARRPGRRWLPDIRKGEFEALQAEIETDPDRAPDFGPKRLGPAGATAVGARLFLVAYNINLATPEVEVAREIARRVRQSSGGLTAVQARGMATADPGLVQVSMNLLDTDQTPLHVVYEAVRGQAEERRVEIAGSEIVGLAPLRVLEAAARYYVKASGLAASQVLEARLLDAWRSTPTRSRE
ncbi:MAG TPA: glutamate formimidoyltransferase [Chloroflexota bacterium]|nr:glutamate formimidoyltransferase [Chloroflexota bacterium]